jgi:protein-S-isoprenylcysteine O-methyltransferase Ste14
MTMFEPAQDSARVIAPPPLIGLGALLIGLALDWILPAHVVTAVLPLWTRLVLGGVLVVGGFALMQSAKRAFQQLGTEVKPWLPSTQIVASGPYRRMRNPMYVAGVLIIAGLAIALASDWILVMLVPTAVVLHYGVVLREERYLERKFGDAYRQYREAVPRYGWSAT